jgi:hypothetical protein
MEMQWQYGFDQTVKVREGKVVILDTNIFRNLYNLWENKNNMHPWQNTLIFTINFFISN